MTEYIDREAAIKALCERSEPCFTESGEPTFKGDYIGAIASVPAADVVEVRRGKWEQVDVRDYPSSNLMVASMWCPVCKRYHNEVYHYGNPTEMAHYCGFCGAKMDGGVNDAID